MDKLKAIILQLSYTFPDDEARYRFYKTEFDMLKEAGFEVEIRKATDGTGEEDQDTLINAVSDADVVVALGNPPFTRRVIEALPRLKVIQRCGSGLNSVDMDAAAEHGKLVFFNPGYCAYELAFHCAALILANLRSVCFYDRNMRQGQWKKGKGYVPRRMDEMTLGLFGLGGSAAHLAKMMHDGFGCRIIATDPYIAKERAEELHAELVSFDTLITKSDIISLHVPLTKETFHIFNKDTFAKMKNDAMLINIARGGLIDYDDLEEALRTGIIGFAGLDTFAKEPMPADHPLYRLDNVVLTPHSAYLGQGSTKVYKYYSGWLPAEALNNHRIYKNHVANPAVLEKFTDWEIIDRAPEAKI